VSLTKSVIVNADDFGQSPGVNRGIIQAFEEGIVTSASLMVRWPAAEPAAAYARAHPDLSLGLHIDLGEWICRGDDDWTPAYEVVDLENLSAVAEEVSRQLSLFQKLVGKIPTHVDSHQHVHLNEPVRSIAINAARELAVPLRNCTAQVSYCGDFYGQTANGSSLPDVVSVDGLIKILNGLSPGLTELGCHPGLDNDLETMYAAERSEEVSVLCDPRIRAALSDKEIKLRSFNILAGDS